MNNKQIQEFLTLLEEIKQSLPSRVIIHLDCDCYECQVYTRNAIDFSLKDYPVVVANPSGRITSVNYKAKGCGISRNIRMDAACEKCPQLKVLQMPYNKRWGKVDTSQARHASWEILDSVLEFRRNQPMTVQHSSCDDYYFDITDLVTYYMKYKRKVPNFLLFQPNTYFEGEKLYHDSVLEDYMDKLDYQIDLYTVKQSFAVNQNDHVKVMKKYEDNARLLYGGLIAGRISEWVKQDTGFEVSCGVGHNKVMAKLATGLNKPNGITMLPFEGLKRVAKNIPIENIRGLGGDKGQDLMNTFGIQTMLELQLLPKQTLNDYFYQTGIEGFGEKVENLRFGIDSERVEEKIMTNTINCGKSFHDVHLGSFWDFVDQITYLVEELMQRIDEEKKRCKREPGSLKIELTMWNPYHSNVSYSTHWQAEDEVNGIVNEFMNGLNSKRYYYKRVKSMLVSVPKFIPIQE